MGTRAELGRFHDDWHGWVIDRDGELWAPDTWRRGFRPEHLRAMFFTCQLARSVQHDLTRALDSIEQLERENQTLEKLAAFYRAQLVAESRLGLALSRIRP